MHPAQTCVALVIYMHAFDINLYWVHQDPEVLYTEIKTSVRN